MDQIKIGSFISDLRKAKGLTQEQFAEIIGVTQKSVSRWETGKNMPDISLLQIIAKELNISVAELLDGEKSNTPIEESAAKAVSQLIDYSMKTQSHQIFNWQDMNFITIVFFALSLVLLVIGAFLNLETIPTVVLGILFIVMILRLFIGRCPGCGKLLPIMIKAPRNCPYCGLDLSKKRGK